MKKVIDILGMIDHIENFGRDYEYYRIYFKDGGIMYLTKEQFMEHDKLYNGKLALKVIS